MTLPSMRRIVAEQCPEIFRITPNGMIHWKDDSTTAVTEREWLEACHQVEKTLLFKEWTVYVDHLVEQNDEEFVEGLAHRGYGAIHATEAQRHTAFIKTVCPEKWRE